FKKPVDVYRLLSRIKSDDKFNESAVTEVLLRASQHDAADCICEAWLAQILLNSLSSSRSRFAQYHYCNLTGSLLLVPDIGPKDYLDIAKIVISSDCLLNVNTVRHRKKVAVRSELKKTTDKKRKKSLQNSLNGPNYIFQESTGSLRRHLSRDGDIDKKLVYVRSGLQNKRASIPFLDFGSVDTFQKSRAGILHFVLKNIENRLSKYMKVELLSRDPEDTIELKSSLLKKPNQLSAQLDGQPIHIVDRVDSEESVRLISSFKELLAQYTTDDKCITIGKRDKPGSFNIRIIHNALYYQKMGFKDEYRSSTDKRQYQNITIESITMATDAVAKTIVKELLIKRDISFKKLSLFDWSKLKSLKTWTFATCHEEENKFIFMGIMPDGQFEFRELDGTSLFGHQEYQQYIDLISDAKNSTQKSGLHFEGLIASEENDVNLIFRTDEISLPNLHEIESILQEIETDLPENIQSGEVLAKVVEEFSQEHPKLNVDKLKAFSAQLCKIGKQTLLKSELKSLIAQNLGTKRQDKYVNITIEARSFIDFLLTKYHVRLKFPQDNQSKDELFDASLNIQYFGETETEAYYFVGDKRENVKFSFKDACHIRKIVAVNGSKLVFKQILPTMDVDFVRTGQSTVIPFPFKYIREYKSLDND
ncbi:MAG: hypothetical protein EA366_03445, partial [Spirulina sp. DLM2.Bin59]